MTCLVVDRGEQKATIKQKKTFLIVIHMMMGEKKTILNEMKNFPPLAPLQKMRKVSRKAKRIRR
jgi:hypothetical protein